MKLHTSVIERILVLVQSLSGHENETKLRAALQRLDFTPYERKTSTKQEIILVLTEDFLKKLQGR